MTSGISSQITLHGDSEESLVYTRRKHISGETQERVVTPEEDYRKVQWRENGVQRLKTKQRRESECSNISLKSDGSLQQPPNMHDGNLSDRDHEWGGSTFSYGSFDSIEKLPSVSEETAAETSRMGKQWLRRNSPLRLAQRKRVHQRSSSGLMLWQGSDVDAFPVDDLLNGACRRQTSVQTGRRSPSASSCISAQSEESIEQPPCLGEVSSITRHVRHRPQASSQMIVSNKSDMSFDKVIRFDGAEAHNYCSVQTTRRSPSAFSCISAQSEESIEQPPCLGVVSSSMTSVQTGRRSPSASSCISAQSEESIEQPPCLGEVSSITRHVRHRPQSSSQMIVSNKSAMSFDKVIHFGGAETHNYCSVQTTRRSPSAFSCISAQSEESIEQPPCLGAVSSSMTRLQVKDTLKKGSRGIPYLLRHSRYRPNSPAPSQTSTESESSLGTLPNSDQSASVHPRHSRYRPNSPSPSHTSTESNSFLGTLPNSVSVHPRRVSSMSLWSCGSMQQPPHILDEGTECVILQSTSAKIKVLQTVIDKHKATLRKRFEVLPGGSTWLEVLPAGSTKPSCDVPFHAIYTEICMMAGDNQAINVEHEVQQIEMMHKTQATPSDKVINCNDIFRALHGEQKHIRTVMTKGIAGIGKTMSVRKVILDWAEGQVNQDVDFMFVLPFRELNLVCSEQHSLHSLLVKLFEELQALKDMEFYEECKLLFILDGLDEFKLNLNFQEKEVCDVNEVVPVSTLVTNLIRGQLLPTALIWVTSRPAAASLIPAQYIHQVTELRGFNDSQKEEFFKRRIADQSLASKVIAHVRATRSLYIMCYIPVFCLLIASMFQQILEKKSKRNTPKTLTELFTEFIVSQIKTRPQSQECLLRLAKLAFTHLQRQQFNFYDNDLTECGIKANDASVLCVEILKEESVGHGTRIYSFMHLTVQEFLAALFLIHSFITKNTEVMESFNVFMSDKMELYDLLRDVVDKSLQSELGHLDLFLRFLLGLSMESNQKLLQSLLKCTRNRPSDVTKKITEYMDQSSKAQTRKRIITYIKELRKENLSPERCINLFHCLIELQDFSMQEEIQEYLRSKRNAEVYLSPAHCSALAYMLLMSEEALEELDLRQYNTTDEGRKRLVPAVRWCRKARLDGCNLTVKAYQTVVLSLKSLGSPLTELDLSYNSLEDSGLKLLTQGLHSPHCKLQALRLVGCHLTEASCLEMGYVLQSEYSTLRELDLSDNDLQDSGLKHLAASISQQKCKVHILRVSMCGVSTKGCEALAEALSCNPSHLKELDLSYNYPKTSGVELLSAKWQDPDCALETLNVKHSGRYRLLPAPQKYFYKLHLDLNTAHRNLTLSERNQRVVRASAQSYPDLPERFDYWPQVLCREPLTGRCYWEVEWTGTAAIGLTYKSIIRKGHTEDAVLGHNLKSVTLYCDKDSYSVYHSKKKMEITYPPFGCNRVGVFLDWPTGSVSFYRVSSEKLLLHTTYSSFTEPLYAGFTLYPSDTVISLCKIGV